MVDAKRQGERSKGAVRPQVPRPRRGNESAWGELLRLASWGRSRAPAPPGAKPEAPKPAKSTALVKRPAARLPAKIAVQRRQRIPVTSVGADLRTLFGVAARALGLGARPAPAKKRLALPMLRKPAPPPAPPVARFLNDLVVRAERLFARFRPTKAGLSRARR